MPDLEFRCGPMHLFRGPVRLKDRCACLQLEAASVAGSTLVPNEVSIVARRVDGTLHAQRVGVVWATPHPAEPTPPRPVTDHQIDAQEGSPGR